MLTPCVIKLSILTHTEKNMKRNLNTLLGTHVQAEASDSQT